ncbi:MAG: NADH-quinone oxidoreductase subunit I [Candidatus Omnitrophota bacterium]|nr:NADH-quinone oxidoreductase subunit I [Candidatus Omnitrophota bacterium]
MKNYFKRLIFGPIDLIKGLIVTFRNLITPAITLQYPTQKQAMTQRYRGLIDLYPVKCIMCSQCVKICPTNCLALTHKEGPDKKKELESFKYKMELCCFCGLCAQVCPTAALYMNKIYEIATSNRKELEINLLNPDKYAEWAHPTVR